MTTLALPRRELYVPNVPTLLKFPLGGAQQALERVSRVFGGAFQKPFQGAFAAGEAEAEAEFSPLDITSLQVMLEDTNSLWQDTARTTPATATDDPVRSWDESKNSNHAQGTTTETLLVKSDGLATGDTSDKLTFQSNVVLTGALTIYAVAQRESTGTNLPFGGAPSGDGETIIYEDNIFYFIPDDGSFIYASYTGTNGTMALFRCTRDGSDEVKFTSSGMAQTSLGTLSGTMTVAKPFTRGNGDAMPTGARMRALYIFNAALSAEEDTNMQAYLLGKYSVAF